MTAISIEDRFAIQDLVHRYPLYCDTRRLKEAVDLFTEDGVLDESLLGFGRYEGRTMILSYFEEAMADWNIAHYMSNHVIEAFSGDAAAGVTFVQAECRAIHTGASQTLHGYYRDAFTRQDGAWLFQARVVVPIHPLTPASTLA